MQITTYVRIKELSKVDCCMSSVKEVYFRMSPGVQLALDSRNESKERWCAGRGRWG